MYEATNGKKLSEGCPKKTRNRPVQRSEKLPLLQPLNHRDVRAFHEFRLPQEVDDR
ncbi:hypothetical protein AB0K16_06005 [Nonomuraea jabiensis]|uniref:hypothetical protein n=1 Tax=Nonomuraea jabiensis TaxID=882448 RepID=UPI0034390763